MRKPHGFGDKVQLRRNDGEHRTLPFGTVLSVSERRPVDPGTVTDRGPFTGAFLDLFIARQQPVRSAAAAPIAT